MVSRALIVERYTDLHHRIIPNVVDNLPEEYLREHAEGENPIAWIYWHMVRTEDVGISRFVLDEEQLYDRWSKRLNVVTTFNGTGMTKAESATIAEEVDLQALKNYRLACSERSLSLLQGERSIHWSEKTTIQRAKQVICEEQTMPESMWGLLDLYVGKTKEWFLLHVCLTHAFYHLGQIQSITQRLSRS